MKKTLQLFLFTLLCSLFSVNASADVITIDCSTIGADFQNDATVTAQGISLTPSKAAGSSAPTYNTTGKDCRLYAKNTLLVQSSTGNMTKIVFNLSSQGKDRLAPITASTGTIATQATGDETVTWTGDAAEVTFTVGDKSTYGSDPSKAGQLDFTSLVITGPAGGGETPDPDPDPEPSDNDGEIVFADLGLENGVQYPDPFDGGTFTITFAGGGNDGKYYNTGKGIRTYGDGTITVTSKSAAKIAKIEFTFDGSYKPETADVADVPTYDPETSVWTGSASSVTLTRPSGNGHWRLQKVAVTLEGGTPVSTLAAPIITGATPFEETTTVTITNPNGKGEILYTFLTDDKEFILKGGYTYTEPITLTETQTVYALVLDGDESSDVASKKFEKTEPVVVQNISEFNALPNNTLAQLRLSNAQVLGMGNKNIIVKDATGGTDLYDFSDVEMTQGDYLTGTIIGKKADYHGITEMKEIKENTLKVTTAKITPTKTTVAALLEADLLRNLFKLESVTVTKSGNFYFAVDGDKQIRLYDQFRVFTFSEEGTYDIVGIVGTYDGLQFWPTEVTKIDSDDPTPDPEPTGDITFDFDNDYAKLFPSLAGTSSNDSHDGDFTETTTSTAVDGATVTVSTSSTSNANRIWSSAPRLRMYSGTFTVNAPAGKAIKGITFTKSANNFNITPDTGTLTDGEWTGSATKIVFTVAKNTQINKMVLSFDEATPELKISGETPFLKSTTVTITPSNPDNDVYYTLDGSDPKESTLLYTKPFEITETTTVKAYEEGAELVAEKTFVKTEVTYTDATVLELNLREENLSNVKLNFNNTVVTYVDGTNIYVREGIRGLMLYNTGLEFTRGQILNGYVKGDFESYYGIPEFKKNDDTNADNVTVTQGENPEPMNASVEDILNLRYKADYVIVKNVTIEKDGNNYYIVDGENRVQLYKGISVADIAGDGNKYNVEGLFNNIYKGAPELQPVKITTADGGEVDVTTVNSIAEMKALGRNTEAKINLTNAQVLYVFTSNSGNVDAYVRDASGAIDFYNIGFQLAQGDVINGTLQARYSEYYGLPELVATANTNDSEITITKGSNPVPVKIGVADAADYVCDLVTFEDVTLTTESALYYLVDNNGNRVEIYNGFRLDEYSKLADKLGAKGSFTGIIRAYNSRYELYVISDDSTVGINNIEAGEADDAVYSITGLKVDKAYKGVVIKNGRKYIQK